MAIASEPNAYRLVFHFVCHCPFVMFTLMSHGFKFLILFATINAFDCKNDTINCSISESCSKTSISSNSSIIFCGGGRSCSSSTLTTNTIRCDGDSSCTDSVMNSSLPTGKNINDFLTYCSGFQSCSNSDITVQQQIEFMGSYCGVAANISFIDDVVVMITRWFYKIDKFLLIRFTF